MLPTMAQTLTVMMDSTTQQRHSRGSTITALLISTQEVSTHLIINGITDRKIPSAGDIPPGGIFLSGGPLFSVRQGNYSLHEP